MAEPMKEKEEMQEVVQETVEAVEESAKESIEEVVEKSEAEEVIVEQDEAKEVEEEKPMKKEEPKMTDANSFVTKVEGFIMFFVMLFMIILCTLTLNSSIIKSSDAALDEVGKLKQEIAELELQVSALETELNDLHPENFDVNINVGKDAVTMTYDPASNAMVPAEGMENVEEDAAVVEEKDFDTRPFLGVAFSTEESTNPFGLKIDYVYEYSPAEDAGLKAGDIIISINGMKVNTFDELDAIISSLAAGNELSIEIATATENGIECVTKTAILSYRGNFDLED